MKQTANVLLHFQFDIGPDSWQVDKVGKHICTDCKYYLSYKNI